MKRYVTYDIKSGNSYEDLYDYFDEIKAKMITKSTYETNSGLSLDKFCNKLKSVTSTGDSVVVITKGDNGLFHQKAR